MNDGRSKSTDNLRCQSPGPNNYRPKSAAVLSRSPTATIGNQERFNKKERILSAKGPGP
jgi:hypothetical protein